MAKQAKAQRAQTAGRYQLVPVEGPSEGVDLRLSPTLLEPGRARMLINWSLEEPGALVVAPGWRQFSTASLGSARISGGARVYVNTAIPSAASTIATVLAWNQAVYTVSEAGAPSAAWLTGLSTNEVYFPADRDLVAAMDGSTRLMKSTNGGSSWTRFGLPAPSGGGPTLSSLSTGGLSSGEYEVNFTYKARGLAVESNGSTAASTLTLSATSGALNVVCPNSTNPDINAIIVYARNKTQGESVRRKASSFAQSGGANSTIILTSSNWVTNTEEPTDHTAPDGLSFGVVWKNRWWAKDASTGNRLRFTQLFQPQSWPALFYVDIPFERGDTIQALQPLGDALMVFGSTKTFLIIGQTSLDFEVRPTLASQDGAFGPRAVCVIENGVCHAGAIGVYLFDGVSDKLLSFDLEPGWRDLVEQSDPAALARVACVYHQKRKELRVAVPRLYPTGLPGEWILDLIRAQQRPAWRASDRDVSGYIHYDGPEAVAGNRGRLLSWASTAGLVNEEAYGYAANGSNQTCTYESPGLTLGTQFGTWVDERVQYEPHGGTFSIEPIVDGVSKGSISLNIGGGQAQYSSGLYGTALYAGAGRKQAYTALPLGTDGRTYVQKMVYAGQEKFKVFSYHVGLVPDSQPSELSD